MYYTVDNYNGSDPCYFYVLDKCIISDHLKNNIIWEKHLHAIFEKYITSESVVVECGAHIGSHTLKLANLSKKVYAFEPMPKTNEILNKNIELNNIENVNVLKKGASDAIGETTYRWIPDGNPGASGLSNNPMGDPPNFKKLNETIKVDLITIDSLNLERLDFMKIDVEGYEPLVIKGAINTIKKFKPVITMEIWKNHDGEVDMETAKERFKDLIDFGYEISLISGPDFLFVYRHNYVLYAAIIFIVLLLLYKCACSFL